MARISSAVKILIASLAWAPVNAAFATHGAGIEISGWVVDWNDSVLKRGLASVSQSNNILTEIDLFRFRLSPEGHVVATRPITNQYADLLRLASEKKLRKLGTVVNDTVTSGGRTLKLKDSRLAHHILRTEALRQRLIADLITFARREQLDGIDVDFENLEPADRDAFSQFLVAFAKALHRIGKRLVVTVHPQLGGSVRNGPGAQDLEAIASAADEVRMMAYHYRYATTLPGPAAPIPWVERIITNAVKIIPPKKLTIAFYVGGWCWQNSARFAKKTGFQEAQKLAEDLGVRIQWDELNAVPFFKAVSSGTSVEVWFENARSLWRKVRLVRTHHLKGIALWHLGQEDPAFYRDRSAESNRQ